MRCNMVSRYQQFESYGNRKMNNGGHNWLLFFFFFLDHTVLDVSGSVDEHFLSFQSVNGLYKVQHRWVSLQLQTWRCSKCWLLRQEEDGCQREALEEEEQGDCGFVWGWGRLKGRWVHRRQGTTSLSKPTYLVSLIASLLGTVPRGRNRGYDTIYRITTSYSVFSVSQDAKWTPETCWYSKCLQLLYKYFVIVSSYWSHFSLPTMAPICRRTIYLTNVLAELQRSWGQLCFQNKPYWH